MYYKIYFNDCYAPDFFEFNEDKKYLTEYALGLFNAQVKDIQFISKEPKKHDHIHAEREETLSFEQDWRTLFAKWHEKEVA